MSGSCELVRTPDELARLLAARRDGGRIGLVPTLGALHAGHSSLVAAARCDCVVVVVSVFLNPYQFDDKADLTRYRSDLDADRALAARAGADVVFAPSVEAMYPAGRPEVTVDPGSAGSVLEGASRPGHLRAVATVVAKLLVLVRPDRLYLGEKDYQQLVVVRRLVSDLSFPVEVVACPTVRDGDGLASSSRNAFLSGDEREAAAAIPRALTAGAAVARAGGDVAEAAMRAVLEEAEGVDLDYAAAVAEGTLAPPRAEAAALRLLVAARLGTVRLIDNRLVER